MNILDRIIEGVGPLNSARAGSAKLLHNVAAHLRSIAGNPTAIEDLANLLDREADQISGHVMENVPTVLAHVAQEIEAAVEQAPVEVPPAPEAPPADDAQQ